MKSTEEYLCKHRKGPSGAAGGAALVGAHRKANEGERIPEQRPTSMLSRFQTQEQSKNVYFGKSPGKQAEQGARKKGGDTDSGGIKLLKEKQSVLLKVPLLKVNQKTQQQHAKKANTQKTEMDCSSFILIASTIYILDECQFRVHAVVLCLELQRKCLLVLTDLNIC